MTTVTPRWEWRTFGRAGPIADAVFDATDASAVAESDETYFLTDSGANVKIRDELVDIKLLRETDENGLERWEPVLKRPFPLVGRRSPTIARGDGHRPGARGGRDGERRVRPVPRDRRPRPAGPDRAGPQAARPLHDQRLHGRALGDRGGRPTRR